MNYINPFEFEPTQEQDECVALALEHDLLKVEAIAGAAKTSTCVYIANNLPQTSLYVTFSKALADEAQGKFPEWVECRTVHSLAFRAIGKFYSHKLSRPEGKYKNVAATGSEIAQYYKLDKFVVDAEHDLAISKNLVGLMAKMTVAKYEASADLTITEDHLPKAMFKQREEVVNSKASKRHAKIGSEWISNLTKIVMDTATKLWEDRCNESSPVLITHDTYVKMYALSNPVIDYDVIYLDESQDSSDVMFQLVMMQEHSKRIFVGDKDQQIFAWRFAKNIMADLDCAEGHLTKSFRFGQSLADLASKVLNGRKILGCDVNTQVALDGLIEDEPYTKLFRTNGALLSEAVQRILDGDKINIESDVFDFVRMLKSSEALFRGDKRKVTHEEIIPYDTWWDLVDESQYDAVLSRIVSIVEGNKTKRYLGVLAKHNNTPNPDVIFCSAHKAKGREWDNVVLADDFEKCYDKDGKWQGLSEEETRLLYVAMTRAKKKLEYNTSISQVIEGMPMSKRDTQSRNIPVNVDISVYSGGSGLDSTLPYPKGDGAQMAFDASFEYESMLEDYLRGDMSLEDAYEHSIVDESGSVAQTDIDRVMNNIDFMPVEEQIQEAYKLILDND